MEFSNQNDMWWTEKLEKAQTPARLKPLALTSRTYKNDHIWLKSGITVVLVVAACWALKTAISW